MYRLGGREARIRYGGSFATKREATIRRGWIAGELAARRVPDSAAPREPIAAPTLREAAERWQASRVDVAENTRLQHRSAVARCSCRCSATGASTRSPRPTSPTWSARSPRRGRQRETIRKSLLALAMILDHAGVAPNPARDKVKVQLPREERPEIAPADRRARPRRPRAAADPLPAAAARARRDRHAARRARAAHVGRPRRARGRWRVSRAVSRRAARAGSASRRCSSRPSCELVPRDDRAPERRVFQGFGGDRFRTAVTRACTAAGVPAFSPHDLRHRRISLLHLGGVPWARIGEHVGQRNLAVTANTYTHVLVDEAELDYAGLLR